LFGKKEKKFLRVTGRKDAYNEVEEFICNTCRFEKKKTSDWVIEGPRHINNKSVISANHYEHLKDIKEDIVKYQKQIAEKINKG
jgi:NADH-quinone oxidoreductase subunit G